MASRIQMIQGSSIAPETIAQVKHRPRLQPYPYLPRLQAHTDMCWPNSKLMLYSLALAATMLFLTPSLKTCLPTYSPDLPWNPGYNPKTAVREYLKTHPEFEIDKQMDYKLLISVAPDGYLKRVR
jgi:cephalosporin hydroxylase